MNSKNKMNGKFQPEWRKTRPVKGSYRSIFKWGDPLVFKHPNEKLYKELKENFNLTDDDFKKKIFEGNEKVILKNKTKFTSAAINKFAKIVGLENIGVSDFERLKYSTGKTIEEALILRQGKKISVTDLVIHPGDKNDVQKIVDLCNKEKIPIYVYGGGSSVNFGLSPCKGGITLALNTHMNKVLEINEMNQTARVQPGLMGPDYEDALNNAPEKLNTKRRYTCGHFPQSFEYSSVGGWVATLGSGQQSSYYGDAYDIVLSQEYITPAGSFKTFDYPATATGPKINDIMKGNEGTFGVLVEVTMKIYRHMPENRKRFSFIFSSFEDAINAGREISQGEFGFPAVFRILDEEETHFGLKLYGVDGSIFDKFIKFRGYSSMKRCLFLGSADGEKGFTKNIKTNVKKICKRHGGMYLTGYALKAWEHGRYKDPYLREDLQDYGIMTDTLEASVTWDNLHNLRQTVREVIKKYSQIICLTHGSHFYPQGANLYFIFIAKINDVNKYIKFQESIVTAIVKNGGSLSHHHGVGKMLAPWLEKHLGKEQMDILRAIKNHLDPNNIMNPGGQLGLDYKNKNLFRVK